MAFSYSVMLDLANKTALVAGGGQVALRKVQTLLAAEAEVNVIAVHCVERIQALAEEKKIKLQQRSFVLSDVDALQPFIVFAATDNAKLNLQIAQYCSQHNILVNNITTPEAGNFAVQAKLERPNYAVSVSTFGRGPGFSKALRDSLAQKLDEPFDEAVEIYIEIRHWLMETCEDSVMRGQRLRQVDLDKLCEMTKNKTLTHSEILEKVKAWLSCS